MTLEELTSPLTREECEQLIYSAIETRGTQVTSWKAGSVARTIITAISIVLSSLSYLIAEFAGSAFLSTSSGNWLTLKAKEDFDIERIGATFARGQVILTNSGGGVFTVAEGDLIVANSTSLKTYRNLSPFTLSASSSLTVEVEAVEAGSASTSAAGFIDTIETTMNSVSVSNPFAIVASDEELDTALRARCKKKLATYSNSSPADAYEFAALNAKFTNGTSAGITRAGVFADGSGGVEVVIAGASGAATGSVGDLDSQIGAVYAEIKENVLPQAVTLSVVSAVPIDVDLFFTVLVPLGEAQGLLDKIILALTNYFAQIPIGGYEVIAGDGGYVFEDAIQAVITSQVKNLIDVNSTTSDIALNRNEVARLRIMAIDVVEVSL